MEKPMLILVTGCPGSGKTTLAAALHRALRLPLLSRDALKEGYVHTMGMGHTQLPADTNARITELFFSLLSDMTDQGVSVIGEAAFQHPVWADRLLPFMETARVSLVVCGAAEDVVRERLRKRRTEEPEHAYFHGESTMSGYMPPALPVQTISVDTTEGYVPSLEQLTALLQTGL